MDLVNLMKSMSVNDNEEIPDSNFHVFAANICGVHTDFVYGEFANQCMICAVQYGKIGGLLKVTVDQPANTLSISEPVYSVNVVFGADNIEQQAAARYLAQALNINKPLLLFLSLKTYEVEGVKAVAEALLNVPSRDQTTQAS